MGDDPVLRRMMGQAVELGQPANDPKHAELNTLLKERGWTDEEINHAHEVARGQKPMNTACPNCEEQELYYSQSIMYEGHRLIVCKHCDAQCVDRGEKAGPLLIKGQMISKKLKGIAGNNAKRRRIYSRRPQG